MTRTSTTKSCDPSESDSETSCQTYRHHYNTRSSGRNCYSPVSTNRRTGRSRPNPSSVFKYNKPIPGCGNSPEMDYCYGTFPPAPRPRTSWFWTALKAFTYLFYFAGMSLIVWTLYRMHYDIEELKASIKQPSSSSRGEDPQAKVFKELNKKYSEALRQLLQDPVGRPDFALESSGGRILVSGGRGYDVSSSRGLLFGLAVCQEPARGPSAMIRATSSPGECWAFQGTAATAVIELIGHVLIDSVTLEHIPRTISPTGNIDSAPKDFKIWGLPRPKRDREAALLGAFQYDTTGSTLQTFKIANNTQFYKYVEFEVLSNHGNKEYTCVYRIRVHGELKRFE